MEGMSGDETDTTLGVCPKFLQCIKIPWLSPRILQLVHAMNSYEPSFREESMYLRLGNTSLTHHYEPCKKILAQRQSLHYPEIGMMMYGSGA